MKFRFTLHSVLEHRLNIEEQRQRELSEARRHTQALRDQQASIEAAISAQHDSIRRRQMAGMNFAERALAESWIGTQRELVSELAEKLINAEKQEEAARRQLTEAVKAREVLDKLREEELRTFQREELRAENQFFDEIAVREYVNERRREKDAELQERIAR